MIGARTSFKLVSQADAGSGRNLGSTRADKERIRRAGRRLPHDASNQPGPRSPAPSTLNLNSFTLPHTIDNSSHRPAIFLQAKLSHLGK